ncbi:hypothetical protein H072_4105 [Dactylellina haptotyla CBS 200.50]|uniref:TOG domain-containing protein n=1 Tax=Dactylellina haptotyla (strain CBS 200.50) TaxID=1284197 RepID=S8BR84_DACHA|nr:hypothetical protein H072_4105 [Dactylellina haptotyla CBS 200.50]
MADPEEDYSSLPLTERATHKIWKVRKQAYEDLTKEFEKSGSETDACFRPWLNDTSIWKGVVADSNVAAQQEGINCLHAFLQFGGPNAGSRSRSYTIPSLAEKGIVSTKAATKSRSIDVILLYIELDTPSPVIDDLIPFLSHKMPKVVAATTNVLCTIYREFGAKTVNPKPVLQFLPKLFAHGDKNVRAETVNLTVELYKWLKDGMKPMFFNDLKPVQQKELEEAFEKVKNETAKQTRLLRSQQAALADSSPADEEDGAEADPDGETDTFDLFEPVEISSKIPKEFWEQINSTKWKDRKESLDVLHGIVNVPRIKEEDFSELIRALAKSMKDANITVVIVAANCVECLAKGLRGWFAKYRTVIFLPIAERLKEKKQTVADALGVALDGIFSSTSLTDILDDTIELLKHKNPQVKLESLRFLIRCLKTTRTAPSKSEVKVISDTVTKLLADTLEATRTAAAETMGTVMKIMGERAMNPFLDGLDDIRKAKIKEFFEIAQVKAKDKPPALVVNSAAGSAPKPPTKKKTVVRNTSSQLTGTRSSSSTVSRGPLEEISSPSKKPPTLSKQPPTKSQTSKLGKRPQLPPAIASPTRSTTQTEDPIAPVSKFGLGPRGGLTARTLQAPQGSSRSAEGPKLTDSIIPSAEKAELERLRLEKETWATETVGYRGEKEKLLQELSDIRLQLIEEHTRDVLSIKAKETQLLRLRSDLQTAEENLEKRQREIDRLKRELTRFSRASSPAASEFVDTLSQDSFGGYPRDRIASASGIPNSGDHSQRMSALSRPRNRTSLAGTYGLDDSSSAYPREGVRSPVSESGFNKERSQQQKIDGDIRPGDPADPNENWKRAAQVTSQLKMRIEQMKARQHMRGVS